MVRAEVMGGDGQSCRRPRRSLRTLRPSVATAWPTAGSCREGYDDEVPGTLVLHESAIVEGRQIWGSQGSPICPETPDSEHGEAPLLHMLLPSRPRALLG